MIHSNCFVIDLDMVRSGVIHDRQRSRQAWPQDESDDQAFQPEPLVSAATPGYGFEGVVAVNIYGAAINWSYNIPVRNIGHLCQVPLKSIPAVLNHRPEVITVYSYTEACHIPGVAEEMGIIHDILLRVVGPEDTSFTDRKAVYLWKISGEDHVPLPSDNVQDMVKIF